MQPPYPGPTPYSQPPYAHGPPFPQYGSPPGPPPPPPPPSYGLGVAVAALASGLVTFLYVGIVGGRAAAEVVLGLLAVTLILAVIAVVLGIQDLRRKRARRGIVTLVLAGLPILIVGTGMLLDKLHRDDMRREYADRDIDRDSDRGRDRDRDRDDDRPSSKSDKRDGSADRQRGAADPVRVELFTMSQCRYCLPAEAALHEVASTLGDDVKIEINYVGKVDSSGALSSMHGPDELAGDLAQVCVAKLSKKIFDFIVCQNQDNKAIAQNWRTCAPSAGVPVDKLEACMTGTEGKELLAASFRATNAKGISAAPTIFVAGAKHKGPRHKDDLMRAICAAYTSAKPAACATVSEAPAAPATSATASPR